MPVAHHHSDVQGDMARHDEEGSGGYRDENDDEEYSNIGGSGDGSGEGMHCIYIHLPRIFLCYYSAL